MNIGLAKDLQKVNELHDYHVQHYMEICKNLEHFGVYID